MVRFAIAAVVLSMSCSSWAQQELRVLTYNIHHAEGTDGVLDVARIAAIVKGTRADIVCLQEVDQGCQRTGGVDMPEKLADLLEMEYAFGPNLKLQDGLYGNLTLSRFPIVQKANLRLPNPARGEPRGCLRTTVAIGDRRIEVWNTHFDPKPDNRAVQAGALIESLEKKPAILAGDMNAVSGEAAIQTLFPQFRDANSGGEGSRRIDYILTTGSISSVSYEVIDTPVTRIASDHLPHLAVLLIRPPGETLSDRGIYDSSDDRLSDALTAPPE